MSLYEDLCFHFSDWHGSRRPHREARTPSGWDTQPCTTMKDEVVYLATISKSQNHVASDPAALPWGLTLSKPPTCQPGVCRTACDSKTCCSHRRDGTNTGTATQGTSCAAEKVRVIFTHLGPRYYLYDNLNSFKKIC